MKQPFSFRLGGTPTENEALINLESWLLAGWPLRDIMARALVALGNFDYPQENDNDIMRKLNELERLLKSGYTISIDEPPITNEDTVNIAPQLAESFKPRR